MARLEQVPHGCCRSHLNLAKLIGHDLEMDMYYVLSASAGVAGQLDFVSTSIWRRTRTVTLVGHGGWIEPNLVCGDPSVPRARVYSAPLPKSSLLLQEEDKEVWRPKPGVSNDPPPDHPILRVDPPLFGSKSLLICSIHFV
jgi:hypothetical protein